ncbi:hypothetical protein H2509_20570 [Stappia sp. F7233]|uniref:Uncharacterized protein n=1 Tax=Stappia albiluteola TaxID=2758565 RepID=A0A839AKY4_9HYPH|nr:hypothetical protein [Stappia albiluteola]MBA5779532.1 hypothetical protein [Stappia albiluteola]
MAPRNNEVGIRLVARDGKVVEAALRNFGKEGEAALKRIQRASQPANAGLRAVDAAADSLKSSASGFASALGPAGAALSALGPIGTSLAVAIGALTLGLRSASAEIAEIGFAARRAGIDVESFQELAFVAEENRIAVDALTDGIKELNLRADEFIFTGGGSAAEAFERLGFSAEELQEKLKDPSALLVEIIGRLEQLDTAARIRIADELFGGTAGEQFVALIDQGAEGIRQTISEAHELGRVQTEEIIKSAEQIDKIYVRISRTISDQWNSALVNVANSTYELFDFLQDNENLTDRSLLRKLNDTNNEINEAFEKLKDIDRQLEGRIFAAQRRELERLRDQTLAEIGNLNAIRQEYEAEIKRREVGAGTSASGNREPSREAQERAREILEGLVTEGEKYKELLEEIGRLESQGLLTAEQGAAARRKAEEDYQKIVERGTRTKSDADREAARMLREVEGILRAANTPAEELEDRLARISELQSAGTFDRAVGGDGAQAGVGDDEAFRARVAAFREYLEAAEDTEEALLRVQDIAENGIGAGAAAAQIALLERRADSFKDAMVEAGNTIADALTDAIFEARSFGDLLKNLALQITRDFTNDTLRNLLGGTPNGGGSSLISTIGQRFGDLIAGRREFGGPVQAGRAYLVGEKRTEVFVPDQNGRILPSVDMLSPSPAGFGPAGIGAATAIRDGLAEGLASVARLASGTGAGTTRAAPLPPIVNVYSQGNVEPDVRQRQRPNGQQEIDVLLRPVERHIAQGISEGGPVASAIERRFGLSRANGLTG